MMVMDELEAGQRTLEDGETNFKMDLFTANLGLQMTEYVSDRLTYHLFFFFVSIDTIRFKILSYSQTKYIPISWPFPYVIPNSQANSPFPTPYRFVHSSSVLCHKFSFNSEMFVLKILKSCEFF